MHGARGGAPRGENNGAYKHGEFSQDAIEEGRAAKQRIKALIELARRTGAIE